MGEEEFLHLHNASMISHGLYILYLFETHKYICSLDDVAVWNPFSWNTRECVSNSQYHCCWWPGNTRSQVISRRVIDLVLLEYSCLNKRVKHFVRWEVDTWFFWHSQQLSECKISILSCTGSCDNSKFRVWWNRPDFCFLSLIIFYISFLAQYLFTKIYFISSQMSWII